MPNNKCRSIKISYVLYTLLLFIVRISGGLQDDVVSGGQSKEKSPSKSIVDDPKCTEIKKWCNGLSENDDVLILECLQSLEPTQLSVLTKECQHVVWEHTNALIKDERVREILQPHCKPDLEKLENLKKCQSNTASASYLKCLVNNKDDIENLDCASQLSHLESVAFYDYRWISNFLQDCTDDIEKFSCGRIDEHSLTQAKTLECLQDHLNVIKSECSKEVYRLSEIQSNNIKLDRQLYSACAEDHNRYCQRFIPGSGRVFNCLMQLTRDKLTAQCHNHLLRRQKLIAQDYRVSKGLLKACRDDIKKSHCRRQTSSDKTVRLAQILLCLENVMKNGTKVDPDCEAEMADHRKMLMEDYRLSPEIVDGCRDEIGKFCSGVETGGKTIHCLMDHAHYRNLKRRIGDRCQRALETLVKETDVGEDWRVDPVLHEACYPVVKAACRDVRGGDARVMSCLMDNIGADHMTEECEDALIQIQYFVARDFKLDPQLYRACRSDARRLCNADQEWEKKDNYDPSNGPLVLPCLYRYAYHPDERLKLNKTCLEQIKRVMRQRAISVDLHPEIERVCLDDLSLFCFDKTRKGEEMLCLQENLEELKDKCKSEIIKYTEYEAETVELNPYITAHCKKVIETHCSIESKNDEGDLLDCLIEHKNSPDVKADIACKASIEHFQLISLKDYRFTYKFKIACKPYAARFCHTAKSKAEVVACLSEHITNDTIRGVKSDIHKDCRQQLKSQLFQQRENIDFDPLLKAACEDDIKKHCADVEQGSAQVLECLQTVQEKLSTACDKEVFKVKKQEVTDNTLDYALMTMCASTIEMFCLKQEKEHVLDCLKKNRNQIGFNKKCRLVVTHRMIEQNSNYRLNPSLQENCKMDIKKFCFNVIVETKPDREINGPVIKCLKASFKHSKLSNKCEKEMVNILRDQALDINLNPLLKAVCKDELATICRLKDEDGEDDVGAIEECLKNSLLDKKIETPACQVEVAAMIEESQADINVDPLLQQACSLDLLKNCNDVPQGNGRRIMCLKYVLESNPKQLDPSCKNMLSKRLDMYKNAARYSPPADLQELYNQVVTSPAKHYLFLMILIFISSVFVIGILCGRVSRRNMMIKNK